MKAYVIGNTNNPVSVAAMERLQTSCSIPIEIVQQTSPDTLEKDNFLGIKWSYPQNNEVFQYKGMTLKGYRARDYRTVFSCLISHARLWRECVELNEEIMILEHDAIFTRKFVPFEWEGGVLGLNDPRGATFNSFRYWQILNMEQGVQEAPMVAPKDACPQGLAGNSAYIIKPFAAQELLDKLKEVGGWPNDAVMCNQFFPWLRVINPPYTALQNIGSTTTS